MPHAAATMYDSYLASALDSRRLAEYGALAGMGGMAGVGALGGMAGMGTMGDVILLSSLSSSFFVTFLFLV